MTGLFPPAAAVFYVQDEIVLQNIIAFRVAQLMGCPVDRPRGAFQFHKRTNRCLVQLDEEPPRPSFLSRKLKRCAVLLIAEPAAHAQPFEDLRQLRGLCYLYFDFLAHFVEAMRWLPVIEGLWPRDGAFEGNHHSLPPFPGFRSSAN